MNDPRYCSLRAIECIQEAQETDFEGKLGMAISLLAIAMLQKRQQQKVIPGGKDQSEGRPGSQDPT